MADHVIRTFTGPDKQKRVLIVRRSDGSFSYRLQERENPKYKTWGDHPWPYGFEREVGWNLPGPCCGIYDSAEIAVWEALCWVEWLSQIVRSN